MKTTFAVRFAGRRYDVGDKQGYLEATIEMALKRPELRSRLAPYLMNGISSLVRKPEVEASGTSNLTKVSG